MRAAPAETEIKQIMLNDEETSVGKYETLKRVEGEYSAWMEKFEGGMVHETRTDRVEMENKVEFGKERRDPSG